MNPGSTIIRDVKIKGTLEFSESLFLDCQFQGEILSDGELTVGEHACVDGEIHADEINLYGKVNGNIVVNGACRIKKSAVLVGDVKAAKLEISEGAVFHGYSAVPFKSTKEVDLPDMEDDLKLMDELIREEAQEKEKTSKNKKDLNPQNAEEKNTEEKKEAEVKEVSKA